ncbi:hypothetical protein CDL12_02295 [Handroanthus impetiginosus]|uniref:Uncharacterized protein n=1 Tax=Handroanthus impetiginosus TaxID=429701 RepID=A0A2G9I5B6_9LAMI|nr:hypothetical protein CDL12_02295 [Handroanthus impetiginosus]
MRRSLGKIPYPVIGRATTTAGFSTASSGNGGGGRGRGSGRATPFQFTVDSNEPENSKGDDASQLPHGHGRGRGVPLPSSPVLPSFSSFLNDDSKAPPLGRGRGFVPNKSTSPPAQEEPDPPSGKPQSNAKKPLLFLRDENAQDDPAEFQFPTRQEKALPDNIMNILSGAGRGKPIKASAEAQSDKPKAVNRHIRPRQQEKTPATAVASDEAAVDKSSPREQLSQEEKTRKAMGILSRGGQQGGGGRAGVIGGRGARGGRGRGRGRFGGRGRGDRYEESDDEPAGLDLGDPADEEKVAQRLGPEVMNKLAEGFEEMSTRVLPSPVDDAYLDALHTNLLIECEPEYLMEEFGTNPDIDEKPPIPLRDALEKMKPFLMAYEGIQSQEEWEEVMEETMKKVPLIKEIVDHYSGPDRVTAKQQQEELERVAKTLPVSAPASVKRFTDRAVLSLQSNPGWGFDKKCQFMDKLVMEVSQQYK